MIRSFRDAESARVFLREPSRRLPADVQRRAHVRLLILDAAAQLRDLFVTRGNRLEKLAGRRAGHYSIRINDQWRICFRWADRHAYEVEICDYH